MWHWLQQGMAPGVMAQLAHIQGFSFSSCSLADRADGTAAPTCYAQSAYLHMVAVDGLLGCLELLLGVGLPVDSKDEVCLLPLDHWSLRILGFQGNGF